MKQKHKNNIKKQKLIIILGFITILLLILAILIATVFYFNGKNKELQTKNDNILYYNEEEQSGESENIIEEGEGDNVLVVGLNEENEENETKEPSEEKNQVDAPYYIKVNNQANVVTIYKKDSKGEYTTPVKAMICSIGSATPSSGVYTMSDKYVWRFLQGNVYGQYACRITGHILFHSVPYESKDKSTLEWWEYDKLGTKASLGCIRLTVEDAKWIYDNCASGTKVEFYSSSNPGPLGKPTARKISNEESVRNWDPTDPDENNPWKEYLKSKESNKNTIKETSAEPVEDSKSTNTVENNISTKTENKNITSTTNTGNKTNITNTTNTNSTNSI